MLPIRGTIEQSLKALNASADFNAQSRLGQEIEACEKKISPSAWMQTFAFFSRVLNLLLYLCAEEPDYDKPPRRAKAKPAATLSAERPPRAPAVTTAGVRIGAVIRKGYAAEKKIGLKRPAATPLKPCMSAAHTGTTTGRRARICRALSGAQMDTACLCRRCLRRYRHHSPGQRRPAVILINTFRLKL